MKFGCSIGIFLGSANLICRSFRGSLRLRDNESRLYFMENEDLLFDFVAEIVGWLVVLGLTAL